MLNIINNPSLLTPDKYIFDVELIFDTRYKELYKHKEVPNIIKTIDNAKFIAGDAIMTPFGGTSIINISSGSKALILALNYPNKIINFLEAGNNAIGLAIKLASKYALCIALKKPFAPPNSKYLDMPILFNGKQSTIECFLEGGYNEFSY